MPMGRTAVRPYTPPDKGTTVRYRISEADALFCPHPLCPPRPQGGRGGTRGSPLPPCGRGAGGEGKKVCASDTLSLVSPLRRQIATLKIEKLSSVV